MSAKQQAAAVLVAQDRLTNAKIAQKVGVSRRTLDTWKTLPAFKAEVDRLLTSWAADLETRGVIDKRRRVYRLNDRWRRLQAVVEKRARMFRKMRKLALAQAKEAGDDPTRLIDAYPGGETGLITIKPTRYGDVTEVDTGLLAELRAIEEHVAIEMGQWKQKHEITTVGQDAETVALADLCTPEELAAIRARLIARLRTGPATEPGHDGRATEDQQPGASERGHPTPDDPQG